MFARHGTAFALVALAFPTALHAQLQDRATSDAIRVTVSINPDGSRTSYEFDPSNRKAVATNTSPTGQSLGKTRYVLDDAGRFEAGEVFAADGKFRFKSRYKYDGAGRLTEETQLTRQDVIEHRIVYSYDANGKQTGYVVYDGAGKVVGRTTPLPSAVGTKSPR